MYTGQTIQSPQDEDGTPKRQMPILAERFKTKLCRTFTDTGSCPYAERCMFAHGEAKLRTKESNLAAKLTTEEAIRNFQQISSVPRSGGFTHSTLIIPDMPATPAHTMTPLSPATTIVSAESRGHKPILAERFKTRLCRKFSDTGSCPYEERCMFAHGEANLRTKEMNLADKLTTEDAISNFVVKRLSSRHNSVLTETEFAGTAPCPHEERCLRTKGLDMTDKLTTQHTGAMSSTVGTEDNNAASTKHPVLDPQHPPMPDTSCAVKSIRFLASLRAPVLGRIATVTPCAADERSTSPTSAASAMCLSTRNGGPTLDLSFSGEHASVAEDDYVRSSAASGIAAGKKRYRHDPYAPVVFGVPLEKRYVSSQSPYDDLVISVVVRTLPAPRVPKSPLRVPSVGKMSTYEADIAGDAAITAGRHARKPPVMSIRRLDTTCLLSTLRSAKPCGSLREVARLQSIGIAKTRSDGAASMSDQKLLRPQSV
jgi:hypothetical protein